MKITSPFEKHVKAVSTCWYKIRQLKGITYQEKRQNSIIYSRKSKAYCKEGNNRHHITLPIIIHGHNNEV